MEDNINEHEIERGNVRHQLTDVRLELYIKSGSMRRNSKK
jgi:hypothetical protein